MVSAKAEYWMIEEEVAAVVLKDQVSSMLLKQTNESAVEDLYFGLILIMGQLMW